VEALEELAIHYEHRLRNLEQALEFTLAALARLEQQFVSPAQHKRFVRRMERLRTKQARASSTPQLR